MSTLLVALSLWLHALATIVMVGYYIFTELIHLPVLERRMQANSLRELLEQVSARLRPDFGCSLLIFLISGTYLMAINVSYLGPGNFFANPWSAHYPVDFDRPGGFVIKRIELSQQKG